MDFSLAALKLMCAQLKEATPSPSPPSSFTLGGGVLFQRVWLQGVIISIFKPDGDDNNATSLPRFLLDDGTGVVELVFVNAEFYQRTEWQIGMVPELYRFTFHPNYIGMYVMAVGMYIVRDGEFPLIKLHKIVDLSAFPDREAMWYLEVIEAYRMFYLPMIEEALNMEEC